MLLLFRNKGWGQWILTKAEKSGHCKIIFRNCNILSKLFCLFSKSIKIEFYNWVIFHITLSEFNGNMYKSPLLSKFTKRLVIALELYISTGITIWHRVAILNMCIYAKVTFQKHQSNSRKHRPPGLKRIMALRQANSAGSMFSWRNLRINYSKTSGRCDPEKSKKYWALCFKVILFWCGFVVHSS